MPHLDLGRLAERLEARQIAHEKRIAAREADRTANAARIHEQLADGSSGIGGTHKSVHCGICGSPFGDRRERRNACTDCRRMAKQDPPGLRDKMSPEELYPESFPDPSENE